MTNNEYDINKIHAALGDLPIGGIRYYQKVSSTNDLAIAWAEQDAPDMSVVITDEQTSGRGRNGRKWFSPAGVSLAFSLILRPGKGEKHSIGLYSALAALAVVQAINELDGIPRPEIKWPNDILVNTRKVCGILTEATWVGDQVESMVIGIGVNVSLGSVPPGEILNFPAASLEEIAHRKINRLILLKEILKLLPEWRKRMNTHSFINAWNEQLAFRGEQVTIWTENSQPRVGTITGLDPDGGLCLKDPDGKNFTIHFGEVHLMPVRL
ncbi:MAG: biotin--[acetyl-CoA-carboxylase] ligase [Chloroflexi bacterium GWB2_49_20]|nr:MAG: biotin--[acetyl-CoA-carboxylase] ligase [Chloroflexi bacterium GWB2_49_20]OGN78444.1 MAG: biotin--[acetyl-CoA-carboxylase] ligase [Chloroflexi bacterium GWC2_49_37]OGN84093.1 MAG: biotin--[acetyl-CoA-carboxylase] ligase [Chloroflexi bacterium GWD2_49_16]HBG75260.1 biotin--[acetyl-CoA-carboxylase] ligase [Anaerolineae bacterium]HCC79105.1 biotin--[acetyl-CoA-carboxylase] ligase [Anaerolineae bacterium]